MNLTVEQAAKAKENIREVCKSKRIPIDGNDRKAFERSLDLFAGKYAQGQDIEPDDLTMIGEQVQDLLTGIGKNLVAGFKNGKQQNVENPMDHLLTASDYLYMACMEKMGCPNIPVGFNDSVKKKMEALGQSIIKYATKYDIKKEDVFRAQRGKDAAELMAGKAGENLRALQENKATNVQVGQLLADYQALCQRQKGHTAIWRFFHRKENNDRVALMNAMSAALKQKLGDTADLEKAEPETVVKSLLSQDAKASLANAFQQREQDPASVYGFEQRDVQENENASRQHIPQDPQFSLFGAEHDKSARVDHAKDPAPNAETEKNDFTLL